MMNNNMINNNVNMMNNMNDMMNNTMINNNFNMMNNK